MNNRLKILHLSNPGADVVQLLGVLEDLAQKYVRYTVYTKEEYTAALSAFSPDIILADEDNTSARPYEALSLITEKKMTVPLVLLNSETTEEEALALLKAGVADYVVKERLWRLPFVISNQMRQKQLSLALNKAISSHSNHSALVKRNKNLEQFTYIISHNLRAPVANIMGLTALLKDMNGEGQNAALVDGLSTSIQTMDNILKDLNHTLQVKNNLDTKREYVYFQQLVDEITSSINHLVVTAGAVIGCDFTALPGFYTLRGYLYSIFYNITLNSIKYCKPDVPPVISIASGIVDDQLVLSFKDNGKGIDMDKDGAALFSLYKRIDTSVDGKGMGMFMVKTQVEDLHGTIEVQSTIGKGTSIFIHFPLTQV